MKKILFYAVIIGLSVVVAACGDKSDSSATADVTGLSQVAQNEIESTDVKAAEQAKAKEDTTQDKTDSIVGAAAVADIDTLAGMAQQPIEDTAKGNDGESLRGSIIYVILTLLSLSVALLSLYRTESIKKKFNKELKNEIDQRNLSLQQLRQLIRGFEDKIQQMERNMPSIIETIHSQKYETVVPNRRKTSSRFSEKKQSEIGETKPEASRAEENREIIYFALPRGEENNCYFGKPTLQKEDGSRYVAYKKGNAAEFEPISFDFVKGADTLYKAVETTPDSVPMNEARGMTVEERGVVVSSNDGGKWDIQRKAKVKLI